MTLLLLLLMTTAIDFSAVQLPSLASVRATLAKRAAVWKPQHRKTCDHYQKDLTEAQWRAAECECPQPLAYYSRADITGYGGAAGGGKSDLLIGTALTQHRRSIIFRREHTQVRSLLSRAGAIATSNPNTQAKVNHGTSIVYLAQGDRQLEFGGIKNPDDWQKHKGNAKDYFGFDEADQFHEEMIRNTIAWNRSTIPGQRCRVILTFNPPTATTGQYLLVLFAAWLDPKHPRPAKYGEIRWYTTIAGKEVECPSGEPCEIRDGQAVPACVAITDRSIADCPECGAEIIYPLSRTFIKALLSDNAFLSDTNYRASLMNLPEPLRSQLLRGDFNADAPDQDGQLIPTKWILAAQARWGDRKPQGFLSAVGADPARGGNDNSAFAPRVGTWFDEIEAVPGADTPRGRDIIEKLVEIISRYPTRGRVPIGMDVIGVGSSPQDLAEELGMHLIPMDGRESAPEYETIPGTSVGFANLRSYWYWQLREALNPETGDDIALPPDRELLGDLAAPLYHIGLRGIQVEPKDDIKKRLGRSPDKGDAVVYAHATRPITVGYETIRKRASNSTAKALAAPLRPAWKKRGGTI